MNKSILKTAFLAISALAIAVSLILFPHESFEASIRGLNIWWEIVFPSLFPFFIVSDLLIGLGVVAFLGILLEPFMRPIFKVPGVGGFVWAMALASGNPSGAKLTARLRKDEQIARIEAERLVAFTSSANPLFIFGAVSVGFFVDANLGVVLGLAHYFGNVCVGIVMRFYGRNDEHLIKEGKKKKNQFSFRAALVALHQTRLKEKRPIGKMLGDSVNSSMQTLLMIGGFIILFSVLNQLLYHLKVTLLLAKAMQILFYLIGFPAALSIPFISGLFEMTLGSQMISQVHDIPLMYKAIGVSCLLAFGGFSIQAQIASILAETDIRFKPFFLARILHAFFAGTLTFLLWNPVYERFKVISFYSDAWSVFGNNGLMLPLHSWEIGIKYGPIITLASLFLYVTLLARKLYTSQSK